MAIHTELTFEENIETSLLENGGYSNGYSDDFDAELGLFPTYITDFLKSSQPKEWKKIEDELRKLSSVSGIHRTFVRQIARSATPSTCDKQGRIMISPSLISYSSLSREVLIIGMINKIEIWNPDILEKVDKNNINNDPNEFNALSDKIVL